MGLKGYTFDRMKISPEADALLYHSMLDGNDRIVKGYEDELKVVTTGLNTYVSPGACIVQGRMIEVDEEMKLSVSANDTGYVCIVIDLTQNNTSTGGAGTPEYQPVNNQIRLEVVKGLVQQDLHNGGQLYTFPLASFTSTGTTVNLTKINHNQRIVESGGNTNGSWTKFADGTMICHTLRRMSESCTIPRGAYFVAPVEQWIYPVTFEGPIPSVTGSVVGGLNQAFYTSGNSEINQIQCTFSVGYYRNSAPDTPLVALTAIGRWK